MRILKKGIQGYRWWVCQGCRWTAYTNQGKPSRCVRCRGRKFRAEKPGRYRWWYCPEGHYRLATSKGRPRCLHCGGKMKKEKGQ